MMPVKLKRICATFLDHLILFFVFSAITRSWGEQNDNGANDATVLELAIIFFLLFFYFPLSHFLFKKIIGKKLFNIELRFVNHDLQTIEKFVVLFIRNVVAIFENVMFFYLVPFLLVTLKGNRLSDLITSTNVLNDDSGSE